MTSEKYNYKHTLISFDELYTRHVKMVQKTLLRKGVAAQDIDDLAQNVFCTVIEKYAPEEVYEITGWIRCIAWRKALDYHRSKKRSDVIFKIPPFQIHDSFNPHETLEISDYVQDAMEQLPEKEQRLLRLWSEGYSTVEISAFLKLKPTSVRTYISRAKGKLMAAAEKMKED